MVPRRLRIHWRRTENAGGVVVVIRGRVGQQALRPGRIRCALRALARGLHSDKSSHQDEQTSPRCSRGFWGMEAGRWPHRHHPVVCPVVGRARQLRRLQVAVVARPARHGSANGRKNAHISALASMSTFDAPNGQSASPGQQWPMPCIVHWITRTSKSAWRMLLTRPAASQGCGSPAQPSRSAHAENVASTLRTRPNRRTGRARRSGRTSVDQGRSTTLTQLSCLSRNIL